MSKPMLTFGGKKKKANYTRKTKGVKKKGMEIETTHIHSTMGAGSHTLNATQRHQGIVKPKMAKKLTKTEKWIERRNFGETAGKSGRA